MTSFHTLLYSRDFAHRPVSFGGLQPIALEWQAQGGPARALLAADDRQVPFEVFADALRCPIEIFNSLGEPVWWGFVNTIRQALEDTLAMERVVSLDTLANRVAARYTGLSPSSFGERLLTSWADDAASQAVFGIKEKIIDLGTASDAEAVQARDTALADAAAPAVKLRFPDVSAAGREGGVWLECAGWFETLNWRYYQALSGVFGNSADQNGSNRMGYGNGDHSFGQSFCLPADMSLRRARVRARRVGTPTDNLVLEIRADSGGVPAASVLVSGSTSGAELASEGFPWVMVEMDSAQTLVAGTVYWLVARRSGSLSSANYYHLGLDEDLSFGTGVMRIYNAYTLSWGTRDPNADLVFELYGEASTTEQAADIVNAAGQFLSGMAMDESGVSTSPYDRLALPAKESLLRLASLGNSVRAPYLTRVSRERLLTLLPKPDGEEPAYVWTGEGRLLDRFGNCLMAGAHPAGEWLRFADGGKVFVESATLDVKANRLRFGDGV